MKRKPQLQQQSSICPSRKYGRLSMDELAEHSSRAGILRKPNQTVLTTVAISRVPSIRFTSRCDEQSYLRFQERAHRGNGVSSANPVHVALANEAGFSHVGRIDFLDNEVNPSTGTIRARVILPNPDHLLTPGLYARVQLESTSTVQALLIDDKAILTDQNQQYVYVVGSGNVAQRKDVVTGSMVDGLRLIRSGLAPGDRVRRQRIAADLYPWRSPSLPKMLRWHPLAASSTSTLAQEASK